MKGERGAGGTEDRNGHLHWSPPSLLSSWPHCTRCLHVFCWFSCEYITCPPKLISPILFNYQHLCLSRVTASLTSSLPGPFFSLPFLPSPSFGQTVPFVQGASGLDGRPGPPVSVTSPLPLNPPTPTPPLACNPFRLSCCGLTSSVRRASSHHQHQEVPSVLSSQVLIHAS